MGEGGGGVYLADVVKLAKPAILKPCPNVFLAVYATYVQYICT